MRTWCAFFLAILMAVTPMSVMAQKRAGEVPVEITVTGEAPGVDENAKSAAVKDAERKAVEEVYGTHIRVGTTMKDGNLVSDEVSSDTSAHVRSRVLSVTRKNGVTKVQVKAQVSQTRFEEAWDDTRCRTVPRKINKGVPDGSIDEKVAIPSRGGGVPGAKKELPKNPPVAKDGSTSRPFPTTTIPQWIYPGTQNKEGNGCIKTTTVITVKSEGSDNNHNKTIRVYDEKTITTTESCIVPW